MKIIVKKMPPNKIIKYHHSNIKTINIYFFIHYEKEENFVMGLSDKKNKEIFLNIYLFLLERKKPRNEKTSLIFTTILHELIHIFYPKLNEKKVEEKTQNYEKYLKNRKFNHVYQISKYIYDEIITPFYSKNVEKMNLKKIIKLTEETTFQIIIP